MFAFEKPSDADPKTAISSALASPCHQWFGWVDGLRRYRLPAFGEDFDRRCYPY